MVGALKLLHQTSTPVSRPHFEVYLRYLTIFLSIIYSPSQIPPLHSPPPPNTATHFQVLNKVFLSYI